MGSCSQFCSSEIIVLRQPPQGLGPGLFHCCHKFSQEPLYFISFPVFWRALMLREQLGHNLVLHRKALTSDSTNTPVSEENGLKKSAWDIFYLGILPLTQNVFCSKMSKVIFFNLNQLKLVWKFGKWITHREMYTNFHLNFHLLSSFALK